MEKVEDSLTKQQFEGLIQYMEDHQFFARGQVMKLGKGGKEKNKGMWIELSARLNQLGPQKTVANYKKVIDAV